jgi:hypothetical protein
MNKRLCILAIGLAAFGTLRADEVEDSITAALKAYQTGRPADASSSLQKALKLLGEKAGNPLAAALPEMIGEWRGGKIESQSLGNAGGGTSLSRTYRHPGKDQDSEKKIVATIAADSPLLGQITTFLKAPALGKLLGAKPKQVGPYSAMYLSKEGILQFAVNARYAVIIQGKKLGEDDLIEVALGVNTELLKGLR